MRLRHDVSDAEPAFFELIEEQGQSLHRHQAPVVEEQDAFACRSSRAIVRLTTVLALASSQSSVPMSHEMTAMPRWARYSFSAGESFSPG